MYGLPPERIWVSVYEQDDEAFALWRDVVGVPPERIKRMGAADNFWASGPTGGWWRAEPCLLGAGVFRVDIGAHLFMTGGGKITVCWAPSKRTSGLPQGWALGEIL